ncbi:MAG: tRNA uridine(34) 5-carboxymethylaminomethyl modification radical SAM/GNAT enzyme Elp3 [Candidatus Nanoarchaeia archaeon]|nr:tRNA uridine(34) 5-carboxymethylaminomethyl modification radical SAM/GNAT enzyme Elp3 [Candidatus Nanoarchaeia archaeon]
MDSYEKKYYDEILKELKKKKLSKQDISKLKIKLCRKYHINIPTDINILLKADVKDRQILKHLITKPTRTISGVAVCAIMTKPFKCPHGKCAICPGGPSSFFGDIPQSYTGKEPATRRGLRNNFDPYLQVMNRLEQYVMIGQIPEKIELIIMGGTFPSFEIKYQDDFIKYALKAMNDFSSYFFKKNELNLERFKKFFEMPGNFQDDKRVKRIQGKLTKLKNKTKTNLEKEQKKNEKSKIRCVGLTIETRPDYAKIKHANQMLKLGATRVELGVQSTYDDVLEKIERGHSVKDSVIATKILKNLGFKINYHMMLGLPGSTEKKDINSFKKLFENSDFKPDMLKIYPCMVLKGTKIYDWWKNKKYKPITTEKAVDIITEIKKFIPNYVRIMRVQRDIPTQITEAGVDRNNLRQYVEKKLKEKNIKCSCIRCREVGHKIKNEKIKVNLKDIKLNVVEYEASNGKEFFISFDDMKNDALIGFCRLRFNDESLRKEIPKQSAIIRELHVFGSAVEIGKKGKIQHAGYGKKLLKKAEQIASKNKKNKMVVISGIGVRDYYRRLGYKKQGPYMVKTLK